MIGYPAYSQYSVVVTTLLNPNIGFNTPFNLISKYLPNAWINGQGQVNQSTGPQYIAPASNGIWIAQKIEHDFQSETPGGAWETIITAARPQFAGQVAYPV
jgi:hypothetical protein